MRVSGGLVIQSIATATLTAVCLAALAACSSGQATTPSSTTTTAPAATTPPANPGAGFVQRGGTTGTVARIDGSTLTLDTQNGQMVVNISADTIVQRVVAGARGDLQVGQFLSVVGATDGTGTVVADSITIQPQSSMPQFTPPAGAGGNSGGQANPSGTPPFTRPADRPAMNGAFGTVAAIDGNRVTLSTQQGQPTTVALGPNTVINKMADATVGDLHVGQSVTVTGRLNDQGAIDAFAITINS